MMLIVTVLALCLLASAVACAADLINHGAPVPLAERRGVAVTRDSSGNDLAIAASMDMGPRGWVLVTDLATGKTDQVWCPDDVPNSPPYGSLIHSNGEFYTAQGPVILTLDPVARQWTWHKNPSPSQHAYLSFIEAPDGTVFAGSYGPACHLVSIDPNTHETRDYGSMDPQEYYLSSLALDDAGWVYCGIGVARANIVACNRETGEIRQLVEEGSRKVGSGSVFSATNGKAYGAIGDAFYELYDGVATPTTRETAAPGVEGGHLYWGQVLNRAAAHRVTRYDMDGKWLEVEDTATKETRRIDLEYESEGAYVRLVVAGPGGVVYGGSGHPPWAFRFDPASGKPAEILGRVVSWQAAAADTGCIYASGYSGGTLSIYDTTRPWTGEGRTPADNPTIPAEYAPDINLPRGTLVHSDGRHILTSGTPGYGYIGGGLGIYDMQTGERLLLKHTELSPEQSTGPMACLPNGDVICGTDIAGGHGTDAPTSQAILFILDWQTKTKSWELPLGEGIVQVRGLEAGDDGLIYGVANRATLFVFDPAKREIVHRQSLQEYGPVAYQGMTKGPDGRMYVALSNALIAITPGSFAVEKLADAPGAVTGGAAVCGGRFYFIVNTHLWSVGLAK